MNTLRPRHWVLACASLAMTACATKGYVRRQVQEASATTGTDVVAARDSAIRAANATRAAADSQLMTTMQTRVDSQIAALRSDIDALRRDFNARVTVMEDSVKFAMPISFMFDSSAVRDTDRSAIERFAMIAKKYYPDSHITIEGFADPAGTVAYNKRLSLKRAESVRDELVSKGVNASNLHVVGYGETRLMTPGASKDQPGAELNRRVVFAVETAGAKITSAMLVGYR